MRPLGRCWLILCALLFSACGGETKTESDPDLVVFQRNTGAAQVDLNQSRPDWLFPVPSCPADIAALIFKDEEAEIASCEGTSFDSCLQRCKIGDASSCYAAAVAVEENKSPVSGALFSRSCQLGFASGCTNRAAGLSDALKSANDCALRTFEIACKRGRDPWGCSMYADALLRSTNGRVDPAIIRAVTVGSCRFGDGDPACQRANEILRSLEAAHSDAGR